MNEAALDQQLIQQRSRNNRGSIANTEISSSLLWNQNQHQVRDYIFILVSFTWSIIATFL